MVRAKAVESSQQGAMASTVANLLSLLILAHIANFTNSGIQEGASEMQCCFADQTWVPDKVAEPFVFLGYAPVVWLWTLQSKELDAGLLCNKSEATVKLEDGTSGKLQLLDMELKKSILSSDAKPFENSILSEEHLGNGTHPNLILSGCKPRRKEAKSRSYPSMSITRRHSNFLQQIVLAYRVNSPHLSTQRLLERWLIYTLQLLFQSITGISTAKHTLDEKYRAKVSDFGTSISIVIDQITRTTGVQGPWLFRSDWKEKLKEIRKRAWVKGCQGMRVQILHTTRKLVCLGNVFIEPVLSNPLSDSHFPIPVSAEVDYSLHYPEVAKADASKKIQFADVGCGFEVTEYEGADFRLRTTNPGQYQNISVVRTNSMKYIPNYFEKGQFEKDVFLVPGSPFQREESSPTA
ncbi:hypothetical protein HAX54_003664 [Datura stramonium]|uniref:Uncharacterized protein n=1 Tax=Datura stramonium TaxID=4076 RepID=A0ABS8WSF0_DATST|nr:hypothetical protein [Datura stramonium]